MTRTSLSESPPCPRCGHRVAMRYVRAQDGKLYHPRCYDVVFPPTMRDKQQHAPALSGWPKGR